MSQASQLAVQHSAIRQQLEKILSSGLFLRSERMVRFLRLAVERTLDGRPEELKEYLVGVEVFDRKPDYDPRVDPIVRVEARRLRSKLKAYYEREGRDDAIVIEFVAGSYAPRIRERAPASVAVKPAAGLLTLAVLPLANLSASPEDEYFSDGMTEELIHALTKVPGMRVVAWNTALQWSARQQDRTAIREQLQVDALVTGSVRIAGPSLRVRAQMIDTASGVYLWSETFDRQMQDVFAIQEEIARNIVRTLRDQLALGAETALAGRSRSSLSAYDYYLKGRYYWHRRTPDDLARGIRYFEAAIAADANYAPAYAGLADGYALQVDYGVVRSAEGMPKVKAAASRAVELDPELAEAYVSLALYHSHYERDWTRAGQLYREALRLNPGYATTHHWMATDYFVVLGRFDEALAAIDVARQLDPLSSIIHEGCGYIRMLMRQYDRALEEYRRLVEAHPTFFKGYTSMGRAYSLQGKYLDAVAMLEKGRSLGGDIPSILGALGQVYALAGEKQRARELLAQLGEKARTAFVTSTCFAIIHIGLGELSTALDWLEKGCERRDPSLTVLKVHPIYDPLRRKARFRALLKRLGLA